jgi:hypothetical protein
MLSRQLHGTPPGFFHPARQRDATMRIASLVTMAVTAFACSAQALAVEFTIYNQDTRPIYVWVKSPYAAWDIPVKLQSKEMVTYSAPQCVDICVRSFAGNRAIDRVALGVDVERVTIQSRAEWFAVTATASVGAEWVWTGKSWERTAITIGPCYWVIYGRAGRSLLTLPQDEKRGPVNPEVLLPGTDPPPNVPPKGPKR